MRRGAPRQKVQPEAVERVEELSCPECSARIEARWGATTVQRRGTNQLLTVTHPAPACRAFAKLEDPSTYLAEARKPRQANDG